MTRTHQKELIGNIHLVQNDSSSNKKDSLATLLNGLLRNHPLKRSLRPFTCPSGYVLLDIELDLLTRVSMMAESL